MRIFFVILLLSISASAWAVDPVALFSKSIADGRLGPVAQQSFCYQAAGSELHGLRLGVPLRIASVTKVFTSLVILDRLPAEYRFQTKFTLANNQLHISGSLDPWFEGEKVLALIAELSARGITRLDSVTFDGDFNLETFGREIHGNPTLESVQASLQEYFTPTGKFSADVLAVREKALKELELAGIYVPLASIGIPTARVSFSPINFLSQMPDAQTLVHQSRPLSAILKSMNAFSNNRTARNLWNYAALAGDPKEILDRRGVPVDEVNILNGSGLGTMIKGVRIDNTASCRAILVALDGLERVAGERGQRPEDILATGLEMRHFDSRFSDAADAKRALLAKTGTLFHTSALAGWVMGSAIYKFAILNQSENTALARDRQDRLVTEWIRSSDFGPPGVWPDKRVSLASLEGAFFAE